MRNDSVLTPFFSYRLNTYNTLLQALFFAESEEADDSRWCKIEMFCILKQIIQQPQ